MSQNYEEVGGHLLSMERIVGNMMQPSNDNDWFIDSKATNHMTCQEEWLVHRFRSNQSHDMSRRMVRVFIAIIVKVVCKHWR